MRLPLALTRRRPQVVRDPEDVVALSRELIAQNHVEIGRADGKAAVLLTACGSLLGFLFARYPACASWPRPLWWTGAVTTTAALLFLLAALLPRHGPRIRDSSHVLAYYEDVVQAERKDELPSGLLRSSCDPHPRLMRTLTGTSRIARSKNRCVRIAVLLLLPAVTAVSAALLSGS
ncbi:Pycsar system effector family protein [Streptomyces sp. NPDC056161]|uniref:Pycsar system effector family protein n=1 Tax=Streptomyces sp. NPDC056161 TaxID=3345732 RepID=UPI0035D56CD3